MQKNLEITVKPDFLGIQCESECNKEQKNLDTKKNGNTEDTES